MAVSRSLCAALLPALSAFRPRYVDRKKFCMSMITSAVFGGEIRIGLVVVVIEIEAPDEGIGKLGGKGRVKSKVKVAASYSQ